MRVGQTTPNTQIDHLTIKKGKALWQTLKVSGELQSSKIAYVIMHRVARIVAGIDMDFILTCMICKN